MSSGWLLGQLPRAMAADPVLAGFVQGFEEVADTVRDRIGAAEHELDPGLASPGMLAYVAAWLGMHVDTLPAGTDGDGARAGQRELIRVAGTTIGGRGTARAVEDLLRALTGGWAEVTDTGGVYSARERVPAYDPVITVRLSRLGGLSREQVTAFVAQEVPVTAVIRLLVGDEDG